MTKRELTQAQYDLIDWQMRPEMLGSFKYKLWGLMSVADNHHLGLIAQGFPAEVEQYLKYTREPGYWQELRTYAESI